MGKYAKSTYHRYSQAEREWLHKQNGKNLTVLEIRQGFKEQFGAGIPQTAMRGKLKREGIAFKPAREDGNSGFFAPEKHYINTGAIHPRWKPIGTIRKGKDGAEIKISDTPGAGRKNWQPLAVYTYHRHYGKPPDGSLIYHINGNIYDDRPENLIAIMRRDLGALNYALKSIPDGDDYLEVRKAIILTTRLEQARMVVTGEQTASMRHSARKKRLKEQQKG